MVVLITGGAGFIGSTLAEKLLNAGERVITIDNFDNYYDILLKKHNIATQINHPNYQLYTIDILDKEKLEDVFKNNKIDVVVHLAGCVGVRNSFENPAKYLRVNINGTINILEKMRKYSINKMVFASSSSVYGNRKENTFKECITDLIPISPYAVTKLLGEKIIYKYTQSFNMNAVCLRLFTVYGPRQRTDLAIRKFTDFIINNKAVSLYGEGSTIRDYTNIDDVISGIISAMKYDNTPYEIINLGGNHPIKLTDVIKTIEKTLNKKALVKYYPMQKGDVERTSADITKAHALLNYYPKTSFDKGMENFIKWYYINKTR